MSAPPSDWALAVCQPGAERWLKAELQRSRPDLHPGFQRPGVVTFRATRAPFGADERPTTVFARAWAASAGPTPDVPAVLAVAQRVGARHLFLGPRDAGVPDEVPPALQAAVDADAARWSDALAPHFRAGPPARGDTVLDVLTFPDEPPVVGWHDHGPLRHVGPAGRWPFPTPADVPSRAWRKIAEGLAWAGQPVRRGELVLELGAAPGGGTRAFVEAGARVCAVDPQAMAPAVLALPGVEHRAVAAGELDPASLPSGVSWLACDAGIPPADALGAIARLLPALPRLRGLLLTLKLVDDGVARRLPRLLDRVRDLGFAEVRATQLAANRKDVWVVATRKG